MGPVVNVADVGLWFYCVDRLTLDGITRSATEIMLDVSPGTTPGLSAEDARALAAQLLEMADEISP